MFDLSAIAENIAGVNGLPCGNSLIFFRISSAVDITIAQYVPLGGCPKSVANFGQFDNRFVLPSKAGLDLLSQCKLRHRLDCLIFDSQLFFISRPVIKESGYQCRPAGLVTGSQTASGVGMKVFVK